MKKALIVANLAGFASFLINDMKLLSSMGYQIYFAANANKLQWEDTRKKIADIGVTFIQIDFDSQNPINQHNLIAYRQISDLLKLHNFSLIHCHTPIAGLITRCAARKYRGKGVKVLYTTHGFAFTSRSSKKSWMVYHTLEKFGSRLCDAMITINKEDFRNAQKMHCKNVFYINGVGVDTAKYRDVEIDRSQYRKSIGVEDDQFMVLSVGELSERKNHVVIIDAIAMLKDREKYVYVICGNGIDGGTGELLARRAKEMKVNLRLLGFRFDIPEIMHCSDIGAIPSIREGLGLAGVQSLAAGVPLVGSDVQGIRDYIIDGETGFLCDSHDPKSFAVAIQRFAHLPEEYKSNMRKACVNKSKHFDKSVSTKQMQEIYSRILAAKEG